LRDIKPKRNVGVVMGSTRKLEEEAKAMESKLEELRVMMDREH